MRQDRNGRPPAEWCATPNAMRLNRLVRMSRRDVLLGGLEHVHFIPAHIQRL